MLRPRSQSNPNPRRPRLPYIYSPLPSPRHIRLIRLLSYDPILSQAYITLTAHPIDTVTRRFTALSYTWGTAVEPFDTPPSSPKSPHTIELILVPPASFQTFRRTDDLAPTEGALLDTYTPPTHHLNLTGNLSDFLRTYLDGFPQRHLQPRRDGSRLTFQQVSQLWIDAVCINQGDVEEKTAQVPLMGEIYASSGRVLGWLGPEEGRLKVFCWWHQVVYPRLRGFVERESEGKGERMMKLREGNFVDATFWMEVLGIRESEVPVSGGWVQAWTDYWAFYRGRRYFHRVWIVQEVVVAGRFEMMAGSKGEELSWDDMAGFAFFLGHVGWIEVLNTLAGEMLSSEYTEAMTRGFGITDIAGMQRQHWGRSFEQSGWPEHWWAVLSSVRRRDCFLMQDKVFATVGILQQALPKGTPLPFPVDATATPEEVYIHAATALLLNCPHLTLLSFIDHPFYRKLSTLPSWVPDLTTAKFPWPLGTFDTPFSACILPSPSQPPRTITPSGKLHLRGFRLTTIASKTEYQAPMNARLAEAVLQFLASMPTSYRHVKFDPALGTKAAEEGQFREAAVVHTLTCHEYSNVNRGTAAETARLSVSFAEWLLMGLGHVFAACLLRPGDEEYDAGMVEECKGRKREIEKLIGGLEAKVLVPEVQELKDYGEAVAKAKKGEGPWPECVTSPQEFQDQVRRVMLYRCLFTTTDGWIGVCAERCEVGDEVWLLEGGALPYVLKRQHCGEWTFEFGGECYVHGAVRGELTGDGNVAEQLREVIIV
jgi:hypothetical protein